MHSKNKAPMSVAERVHVAGIKDMNCIVCDAPGPSDAHEPEQGMWWISIPLCRPCHTGPQGWHGTRDRWKLRKMTELKAINSTLAALYGSRRAA